MTETIITLSNMNCGGCVRKVTNALQALLGVEITQTDLPTKTVHVRYAADLVSLEQIKTALAEAHYPVVAERLVHEGQYEQIECKV